MHSIAQLEIRVTGSYLLRDMEKFLSKLNVLTNEICTSSRGLQLESGGPDRLRS